MTALFGLVLVVLSDGTDKDQHVDADEAEPQSHLTKVWGDALCILAAGIYALSNVGQEILIKEKYSLMKETASKVRLNDCRLLRVSLSDPPFRPFDTGRTMQYMCRIPLTNRPMGSPHQWNSAY